MRPELEKKVRQAVRFLQSIPVWGGEKIEVCYSGGKDSDVILQLAREAGIPFRAIYKCTTIDPPGTTAHAKRMGAEVVMPKMPFSRIVEKKGCPNMYQRFCCSILKEYKILDKAIVGVRRSESTRRANRYKEPELCRVYSKTEKTRQYFPILEWTDEDVAEFISDRKIQCHPLYYDEDGNFHVERRLGCIGCPMAWYTKRREMFSRYPKFLRCWIKWTDKYFKSHPDSKIHEYFGGNVYMKYVCDLFYPSMKVFNEQRKNNMFGEIDYKKFLEDYFKIDL